VSFTSYLDESGNFRGISGICEVRSVPSWTHRARTWLERTSV
ncbi:MAG: hypothetical protein AVDCRST_MAG93-1133, partial [uncultured Chloroflexia bacterium]